MHIPNPDELSDEDWAAAFQELQWIRREEERQSKA
jgi:hypothetical protein